MSTAVPSLNRHPHRQHVTVVRKPRVSGRDRRRDLTFWIGLLAAVIAAVVLAITAGVAVRTLMDVREMQVPLIPGMVTVHPGDR